MNCERIILGILIQFIISFVYRNSFSYCEIIHIKKKHCNSFSLCVCVLHSSLYFICFQCLEVSCCVILFIFNNNNNNNIWIEFPQRVSTSVDLERCHYFSQFNFYFSKSHKLTEHCNVFYGKK